MSEIAENSHHEVETFTAPSTQGLQRLRAEVEAMKDAATMARGMAAGGFIPEHWLKDKSQEQAIAGMAAAILFGAELGLSAMRSLNELFMVRGKPAMYSRTMAALVRAAGYVIEPVEESDDKVVWKGYRDGAWKYSEWTMERAKTAGYTTNKLYQTNPKEMLRAKCITEVCRIAFQDVLLGLDYSMEELDLIDGVTLQRPVRKGGRGAAALRELADAAPNIGENTPPPGEQEAAPVSPEPKPAPEQASDVQIAEIAAYYKKQKVATVDAFVDITQILQRETPVESYNDITPDEAEDILRILANA